MVDRRYVHHIVEANLIASHVILFALAKPGCIYDWSWVTPDKDWMIRLSYDSAPIGQAVHLLEALSRHLSNLIVLNPRSLKQSVNLLDIPGGVPRKSTIERLLQDEVSHANNHIADIESAKQTRRAKK